MSKIINFIQEKMINETILNLLQKLRRQWYKPDLHSFKARIKNGVVFVDCDQDSVRIDAITYDKKGDEIRECWTTGKDLRDAVEILARMEIDPETIET